MLQGQEKVYYLNMIGTATNKDLEENIYLENYKNTDLSIIITSSPFVLSARLGAAKDFSAWNFKPSDLTADTQPNRKSGATN